MVENALQHAVPTCPNLPEKTDWKSSSTHPWTLKRDDQHFSKSMGKLGGDSDRGGWS